MIIILWGPFHGAIAVPSVTRCRCRRRRRRCPSSWTSMRRRHLVNGRAAARSGEWAQQFSNASHLCYLVFLLFSPLCRVADRAKIWRSHFVNPEVTGLMFTKFLYYVEPLLLFHFIYLFHLFIY